MLKKGLHTHNVHHTNNSYIHCGKGWENIMEIENNCTNYKGKRKLKFIDLFHSASCQDVILPIIDNMNKGRGNKKGRELFSAF